MNRKSPVKLIVSLFLLFAFLKLLIVLSGNLQICREAKALDLQTDALFYSESDQVLERNFFLLMKNRRD